jgi:YgiT-type zinc finger domain-containing protein
LEDAVVRHAVTYGSRVIVFTDVPARVCRQCGEPFFAGSIVDAMNRFAWGLGEAGEASRGDLSVHVYPIGAALAAG